MPAAHVDQTVQAGAFTLEVNVPARQTEHTRLLVELPSTKTYDPVAQVPQGVHDATFIAVE